MKLSYATQGTCAVRIDIEVTDGKISSVEFLSGCPGNTRALAALVVGMDVGEAIARLKGIACQGDTSCPDQLARALETTLASPPAAG